MFNTALIQSTAWGLRGWTLGHTCLVKASVVSCVRLEARWPGGKIWSGDTRQGIAGGWVKCTFVMGRGELGWDWEAPVWFYSCRVGLQLTRERAQVRNSLSRSVELGLGSVDCSWGRVSIGWGLVPGKCLRRREPPVAHQQPKTSPIPKYREVHYCWAVTLARPLNLSVPQFLNKMGMIISLSRLW